MSLERKLPLLVIAVLIATLATAVGLAYREVRQSAELAASARIQTASRQLASLVATGISARAKLLHEIAATPAVVAATANPDASANATPAGGHPAPPSAKRSPVAVALHRLVLPNDSTLAIELWSASGQLVDSLGSQPEAAWKGSDTPHSIAIPGQRTPQTVMPSGDRPLFLPFFEGADHHVYYWMTVPVLDHGKHIGWIAEQGRIKTNPSADKQLNALLGEHTAAYLRNRTGDLWTTIGGVSVLQPERAPTHVSPADSLTTFSYSRPGHGPVLATATAIDGTPWWLALEVDRSVAAAGARSLLVKFSIFSLLLLIAAAAVSWLLIRRAVRPLVDLTDAATSMARGDYSARVAVQHEDEVGRLGLSFNEMAGEVAASHARLAGQVQEAQRLATELDQARDVAVTASKAKSHFLATMSHEIRTPINAIMGYADILDLGISGPLTAEQHENLRRIRTSSSHLLALVNDVLDLSKIESGTMQVRTVAVQTRPCIDAAVALVEPMATAKRIRIALSLDDPRANTYVGDERGVQQALANLLSNAVKFTNPGGEISVACSLSAPPEDSRLDSSTSYVAIRVSDTGIGIDNEKIPQLFQPFTQLEADNDNPYTRQRSGAGLGLSISRRLARMMGGDITVESLVGDGSVFTLWLPHQGSSPAPGRDSALATTLDRRAVRLVAE
jgi:signal transduction histidine kinase